MRTWTLILAAAILSCGEPGSAFAQNLVIKRFGMKDSMQTLPANSAAMSVVENGKIVSSNSVQVQETANLIIELSASPVVPSNGKTITNSSATVQRNSVAAQIAAISSSSRISRQFSTLINGIALSAKTDEINDIARLAGVKRVYEDRKVSAFATPPTSHPRLTSPASPSATAARTGAKVGVIDTGIDYLHEAFGKGFGPGYAVAGGYDFVNNRSDPLDDNGHGTHVAGIIAGNSATMSGIAPGATLYSYKVLDASGSGLTSTVIAAIEQAIRDSVDIINLSLGSPGGDPDDLLSKAVDGAVRSGIVVVVAAGNESDYGTISSPGAAREALTVGALDLHGNVASFSSRGPSNRIYGVKPEVVAPGESILSAKMGGGYISMSGTSTAAPFVSGTAAKLRELHPGWSATEIRDALVGSSRDIHSSLFSEGKGKIDTSVINGSMTFATPSVLSFGFDNVSSGRWSKIDSLLITNFAPLPKQYTVVHRAGANGVDIRFSPSVVNLFPGERKYVSLELTAEGNLLPDNTTLQNGYTGKILAISQSDTLTIPYTFFKGSVLQIAFNETPLQVVIHDRKKRAFTFTPQNAFVSVVVPGGTYDIVTCLVNSAYVVREGIQTGDNAVVTVDRAEAKFAITVFPIDETGKALTPSSVNTSFSFVEALLHAPSGIGEVLLGGGKVHATSLVQKKWFSPLSKEYSFGYALNVQYGNSKSYTVDVALDTGITSSYDVKFSPSDLKRVDFRYNVDSTLKRIYPLTWSSLVQGGNIIAVTYYDGNDAPLRYPFLQTGYYARCASTKFPIYHYREAYKY